MIQFFKDVKIDWLANRRKFIAVSILLMLAGLSSAVSVSGNIRMAQKLSTLVWTSRAALLLQRSSNNARQRKPFAMR